MNHAREWATWAGLGLGAAIWAVHGHPHWWMWIPFGIAALAAAGGDDEKVNG